jgi:3-methyladenine DNA glycosylase/8-oxoguanine DNA glycosylase
MKPLSRVARFRFKPRPPYNFRLTVRKPAGWSWFTPFEHWENGTIWSGFWLAPSNGRGRKRPVGIRASSSASGRVVADIFAERALSASDRRRLRERLRRALGVDEDLKPLYRLMRRDRVLKHLAVRLYGMHRGWGMGLFSSLTLAVLLQMAPIQRSENMWACLLRTYGRKISFDGRTVRLWPSADRVASLPPRDLARRCRLGYRARFLVKLARQLRRGFPDVDELASMPPEEARSRLMGLYGVGEYTAGFASPHPSFSLDVWSVQIFYPLLFGRPLRESDRRSAIPRASRRAEKLWGPWRGAILVYVLNDLEYLGTKFGIPAGR